MHYSRIEIYASISTWVHNAGLLIEAEICIGGTGVNRQVNDELELAGSVGSDATDCYGTGNKFLR